MDIRTYPKIFAKMCEDLQRASDKQYPASPVISGMPHGSGYGDRISDAVSILNDEKNRLYEYVASIREKEHRAWNDTLKIENHSERHAIILYFFQRVETWDEVAEIMNYSLSQVKRHRDNAYVFLENLKDEPK